MKETADVTRAREETAGSERAKGLSVHTSWAGLHQVALQ